jgi:hypothetical protein
MSGAPDIKYDITPYDGTPGQDYANFEERLLNAAARADDRGWSLAEHFMQTDEGSPLGPPIPGAGAVAAKAQTALRKRQKDSYAFLLKHITNADLVTDLRTNHFLNGQTAFAHLRLICAPQPDALELRELNREFDSIDILHDCGVNEHSINTLCKKIRTANGRRPAANRKTETEMTERLLEVIFTTSKHFSETATNEFRAPAGQRRFEPIGPCSPATSSRSPPTRAAKSICSSARTSSTPTIPPPWK